MARARLWIVAALPVWLLAASPARAETARSLYLRAVQSFSEGALERSVDLLKQARAQAASPELLGAIHLYLGVNHEALGDAAAARQAFAQALKHDPTLTIDAKRFKASIVKMFEGVRRDMQGTLSVSGAGDTVSIDGGPPLRVPFIGQLPVGLHRIEVRSADSSRLLDRQVVVAAGRAIEVVVPPAAVPPPPSVSQQPPPEPVAPPQVPLAAPAGPVRDAPVEQPKRGVNWPAWLSLGTAVAAGAVGIGLGVASRANEQHALDLAVPHPEAAADHDTAESQALAANVLFVVSGVAAVATVVLFYTGAKRTTANASPSTPEVTIGATSVGVRW
jgi:tetratricopeptide (TPR) repeat protein